MTNFYRHLSNCQPHHTVQIFVVSTIVLTKITMHNTAIGTTMPNAPHFLCPAKVSQFTHLSTINVYNVRPIDSAHFAQPMSHDSTYQSPILVHFCNNSLASSTCIVSYIGRQYARIVPNVDIVGSSKCHNRHLATGGIACHYLHIRRTS
jgi:hypothetical protein